MREAVEGFAKGEAKEALALLDSKGRLKLISGQEKAATELILAWAKDKTPLASKAIVAATHKRLEDLERRHGSGPMTSEMLTSILVTVLNASQNIDGEASGRG